MLFITIGSPAAHDAAEDDGQTDYHYASQPVKHCQNMLSPACRFSSTFATCIRHTSLATCGGVPTWRHESLFENQGSDKFVSKYVHLWKCIGTMLVLDKNYLHIASGCLYRNVICQQKHPHVAHNFSSVSMIPTADRLTR